MQLKGLFNTGASMSVMSVKFHNLISPKPKLFRCIRLVSSTGGDSLHPAGECFIKIAIGKKIFRDRVIVVKYLSRPFILGVEVQRANRMGMGYSKDSGHFITIKGGVIAQSCQSMVEEPILKMKGKIVLKPNSISVLAVKTPKIPDTEALYKVNCKFQLLEEIIPLDILHRVDHKILRELNIHILNTGNNSTSLGKNTLIGTFTRSERIESICNIDWSTLNQVKTQAIKQVADLQETKEFTNQQYLRFHWKQIYNKKLINKIKLKQ